jgi:hypothetical protein
MALYSSAPRNSWTWQSGAAPTADSSPEPQLQQQQQQQWFPPFIFQALDDAAAINRFSAALVPADPVINSLSCRAIEEVLVLQ